MRRRSRPALGLSMLLALAGCSPALDWRDSDLDGPGLLAVFPCRPIAQSRGIELAGAPVALTLHACEAAGTTYAVSVGDVHDPAHVGAALKALHTNSIAKIGDAAGAASAEWAINGMTPQPMAGRWRLSGHRSDGALLTLDTAVFARGTWVVQASVIGAELPPPVVDPFFEGLRFPH